MSTGGRNRHVIIYTVCALGLLFTVIAIAHRNDSHTTSLTAASAVSVGSARRKAYDATAPHPKEIKTGIQSKLSHSKQDPSNPGKSFHSRQESSVAEKSRSNMVSLPLKAYIKAKQEKLAKLASSTVVPSKSPINPGELSSRQAADAAIRPTAAHVAQVAPVAEHTVRGQAKQVRSVHGKMLDDVAPAAAAEETPAPDAPAEPTEIFNSPVRGPFLIISVAFAIATALCLSYFNTACTFYALTSYLCRWEI